MSLLTIDAAACERCGACAEVCPSAIIFLNEEGIPYISGLREKACITCGHCEAVCAQGALTHAHFQNTQSIRKDLLESIRPENLSEYFRARRSIRSFLSKRVSREALKRIMETVAYAPTGVNMQMNEWVIVDEPAIIRKLSDAVIEWMKRMLEQKSEITVGRNFKVLISSYEQVRDVICRNAPCLAIGYTAASFPRGAIDVPIAASHLELLLPVYGLGGCWAGYLMTALRYAPELREIIGLDTTHAVHAALMIGYPTYTYAKIPARKSPQVRWM
jgi:nitroreductase/NAD-dependent dihydropyrimidine dehydrogenase PreA subunit